MKYMKRKGYTGTIRKVIADDNIGVVGIVGLISDLLNEGVFNYIDAPGNMWAFIECESYDLWLGYSREEAVDNCLVYKLPCMGKRID